MSRFRKIDTRTFGDSRYRQLTKPQPCGQYLWLWLLAGPATCQIPGVIYNVGPRGMAELLGWPDTGFRDAFQEVVSLGMAMADFSAPLVFLPKAIKYNPPQSPNVVASWSAAWKDVPECELKQQIRQVLAGFVKGIGEGFQEAFEKACPKPFTNQEQLPVAGNGRQEQETPLVLHSPTVFPERVCDRTEQTRSPEIPEWVPIEPWNGFLEMRRAIKAPLVGRGVAIALRTLEKLTAQGEDAAAVLDQSTVCGWKRLFEVKKERQGGNGGTAKATSTAERKQQQNFSAIDRATEIRRHRRLAKPANEDSASVVSTLPSNS